MNYSEEELAEALRRNPDLKVATGMNGLLRTDSHMAADANNPATSHARILADNDKNEPKVPGESKPSKYHNQRTNGYPSKKHAQYAAELELCRTAGEVWFWLEEVAFKLPGGIKHRVDFMVFYHCHIESYKVAGQEFAFMKNWELIEIKGRDLPMGKLKRKQVEDIYKVRITVI